MMEMVTAVLGLALLGYALWECQAMRFTRIQVELEGLPTALEGMKVLHLSDVHVGSIGRREAWLIRKLKELEPDVLAVTGDLVSAPAGIPFALEVLRHARWRRGAYFTNGNNEIEELHDLKELHQKLKELGIVTLCNDHRVLDDGNGSLVVAGVDDPKNNLDDLEGTLARIERGTPIILLSHTPETFEPAAEKGVGLVLSGHTHGGQVRVPFFGALWTDTPRTGLRYSAGVYRLGRSTLIVSRGMGWSLLPVRFNCPPEIIEVTLRRAPV